MSTYTWSQSAAGLQLTCDGQPVGALPACTTPNVRSADDVRPLAPGVFQITRRFTLAPGAAAQPARLTLDFLAAHTPQYAMIPAVSYNGNTWGTCLEHKGFEHDGVPWSFAFHRTAIAGATYAEGPRSAVGLFGQTPAPACGFSCSLFTRSGQTIHRLIWPEEEQPLIYSTRDKFSPGYTTPLRLEPGQTFEAVAYLIVGPVTRPRWGWTRFLDEAWKITRRDVKPRYTPQQVWDLGMCYTKDVVWAEEGDFKGLSIGLVHDGEKWFQRKSRKYEIGWAGQNGSLACSMLHDHLKTRDADSLRKGLATLDTWTNHGRFPSGLIYAIIDPIIGLQRKDIHDACNLGNAAADYLEAYDLAHRAGADRPDYRTLALTLCDFFLKDQQPDGCYGRAWNRNGECLARGGTIGSFIVPAMIAAYRATQKREYLASAERAFAYYINEMLQNGFTTAGALDSDCIDKESAWPLIDAGWSLYDLTKNPAHLEAVELASYFFVSWQYNFSVPVPPNSMFVDMGYDSYGGTAVSTAHHHIDPWGARMPNYFFRLAEATGNALWIDRARATWANALHGLSDGNLCLRGTRLPRGTQCEGYFQTRWIDRGDSSFLLVAWPTAFRLETLRRLTDWSKLA